MVGQNQSTAMMIVLLQLRVDSFARLRYIILMAKVRRRPVIGTYCKGILHSLA
jgi:hypothetical protein